MAAQTLSLLATVVDFMATLPMARSVFRVLLRFFRQLMAPTVPNELRINLVADLVTALSVKSGACIIRTLTLVSWSQFLLGLSSISRRFFLGQALKRLYR